MLTKKEFMKQNQLTEEMYQYLGRGKKQYLCSCGNYRILWISKQSKIGKMLGRACGRPECDPKFGRKRPRQSKIMKALAADPKNNEYRNTLMQKGKKKNPKVNTIEFKRKVLQNCDIDVRELGSKSVKERYSLYLSDRNKSVERRRKQILNSYLKWDPAYKELIVLVTKEVPTLEWVSSLSDFEVHRIWKRVHGISTIRNWDKISESGRGFYKRKLVAGLKFNTQRKTSVVTRSEAEEKYINLFEKNKIPWSYEELRIETIMKDGFYKPDFIINHKGQKYLIEVKGKNWYRQDKDTYIKNRCYAAHKYATQHGWVFGISYNMSPKDMSFIDHLITLS